MLHCGSVALEHSGSGLMEHGDWNKTRFVTEDIRNTRQRLKSQFSAVHRNSKLKGMNSVLCSISINDPWEKELFPWRLRSMKMNCIIKCPLWLPPPLVLCPVRNVAFWSWNSSLVQCKAEHLSGNYRVGKVKSVNQSAVPRCVLNTVKTFKKYRASLESSATGASTRP